MCVSYDDSATAPLDANKTTVPTFKHYKRGMQMNIMTECWKGVC